MTLRRAHGTDRRQFLRLAGAGAAGLFAPSLSGCSPEGTATAAQSPSGSDTEIELVAGYSRVPILPGPETNVARFTAELLKGSARSLKPSDSYLGPTIEAEHGQWLRIHFRNRIDDASIVHWHGLHVPFQADGHPSNVIETGERYQYDFEIKNRAGLYWYHPHPHEHTGEQVYSGLAGLLVVRDEEERALGLPAGDQELTMVLQDRRFDEDNQLHYLGSMMERMSGFLGSHILVNGRPDPTTAVATRPYRLRLLNGSNSRIYKLGWSNGMPLTVIGNDGGLLERPLTKPYITLSPSERVDLWADFSELPIGTELEMRSLAFSGAAMVDGMMGGGGMMMGRGGMMGGGGMGGGRGGRQGTMGQAGTLANGGDFRLFRLRVEERSTVRTPLPMRLSTIPRASSQEALDHGDPIGVTLSMEHMTPAINGRTFQMTRTAQEERVKLGSRRLFVLENAWRGGSMMTMPHPIHFHGQQFQVVGREPGPSIGPGYSTLREGFVDEGWKDTVLVFPGERVTIVKAFDDFTGLFLYHCHLLEHEDLGMMRNLQVSA